MLRAYRAAILAFAAAAASISVPAQQAINVDPGPFAALSWRNIGPHRASRTVAAAGHRAQPFTFYMAQVNGGVWKTTDAGRTWNPIFDEQQTGSIGSIVVAPSDPNVVYVGSGEGLHRPDLSTGNGVYKSTDAGSDLDAPRAEGCAADPEHRRSIRAIRHGCSLPHSAIHMGPTKNEASSARPTAAAPSRESSTRTRTPAATMSTSIPSNPDVVYATLWEERQGPWENAVWAGTGGGIFKSIDGGTTWKPLTSGLPQVVQANLAISPANPKRIFAAVAGTDQPGLLDQAPAAPSGIYRSDDAGETLDADYHGRTSDRPHRWR